MSLDPERVCPPHDFRPNEATERDECHFCGVSWRDWTFGFGSNVQPRRHWKDGGKRRVTTS